MKTKMKKSIALIILVLTSPLSSLALERGHSVCTLIIAGNNGAFRSCSCDGGASSSLRLSGTSGLPLEQNVSDGIHFVTQYGYRLVNCVSPHTDTLLCTFLPSSSDR